MDEINRQNRQMKEGGYFEKAGLKNEEDIADYIRQIRDEETIKKKR